MRKGTAPYTQGIPYTGVAFHNKRVTPIRGRNSFMYMTHIRLDYTSGCNYARAKARTVGYSTYL